MYWKSYRCPFGFMQHDRHKNRRRMKFQLQCAIKIVAKGFSSTKRLNNTDTDVSCKLYGIIVEYEHKS